MQRSSFLSLKKLKNTESAQLRVEDFRYRKAVQIHDTNQDQSLKVLKI